MYKLLIAAGLLAGVVVALIVFSPKEKPTIAQTIEGLEQTAIEVTPKKTLPDIGEIPVPGKTGPWPKIVVPDPVFHFGRMPINGDNFHAFEIRNEGEAELRLKAGNTTCKCTTFGFGEDEKTATKETTVKPGEKVTLLMHWHAGAAPERSFRHGGDLYTNDPKNSSMKIVVEGSIDMPFEVLPQTRWDLGNVYEEPVRFKGAISSKLYNDFRILSIESPSGFVTVDPRPMTSEELGSDQLVAGYTLYTEVSNKIPSGFFEEQLIIRTSADPQPTKVTVVARKHGAIRIQQLPGAILNPDNMVLQLGSFRASEGREAKLLLIVDEKDMTEPFAISKTESDPSFLSASISPLGEPTGTVHRYQLTVRIPPGRPHAQKTDVKPGVLKLSTNHPSGDGISLGITLYSN